MKTIASTWIGWRTKSRSIAIAGLLTAFVAGHTMASQAEEKKEKPAPSKPEPAPKPDPKKPEPKPKETEPKPQEPKSDPKNYDVDVSGTTRTPTYPPR